MNARRCCIVLVLLAMPLAARAGTPKTGLYQLNEGDNGQLVQRGDTAAGGEIRLGDLLSEKLSEASLVSVANDNSLFRLSLKAGPIPEGADRGRLAVVSVIRTCQCMAIPTGGKTGPSMSIPR